MDEMFKTAFAEDKDILAAIQLEENRPARRRPIRIAIDKGPLVYRKRISELMEKERTENLGAERSAEFVCHE